MKKIIIPLVLIGLIFAAAVSFLSSKVTDDSELSKLKQKYLNRDEKPFIHDTYSILQKKFTKPQDVTVACISCHIKRAEEVMHSNHWNWEHGEYIAGKGVVYLGKKNAINNFCIGIVGNEKSCAKCHIGFGMNEKSFSFTDPKNIDCLICHDITEKYAKASEMGGEPDSSVDLNYIAQHVGKPRRSNCGVCHFLGGGGNNVKHGDLEESMFSPTKETDVHMSNQNSNLECIDCHKTKEHIISGKLYSISSMNRNRVNCENCHSNTPHDDEILNEHNLKVACQTCHISVYAKENATKTEWDWSTAGKLKNGEPYEENDTNGNHTYLSIKGSFKWGKNIEPEYIWFNGTATHYLLGDIISDTTNPLILNQLYGKYSDEESKIIPVKIHRTKQPFDPINKILIQPKLYADNKGEGGFWKDFDWITASKTGMERVNLPFSGTVTFIRTEMYWPVNHMVSPKENSVKCTECHNRNNSRLKNLTDFYMPGRDKSSFIDNSGISLIFIALIGVIIHGSIRFYSSRKLKGGLTNEK
jgi:octaheme c-type cytochrome (tetrathionate reductase family)